MGKSLRLAKIATRDCGYYRSNKAYKKQYHTALRREGKKQIAEGK